MPWYCTENPKDSIKKTLRTNKKKDNKASWYEKQFIKMLYFFMLKTKLQQGGIKKTIPFTIISKRIKYLGINLTKEVKDLYIEHTRH